MSKITDASFIAHQYTSVSRKVLEKANRYTLFENRLRSCPILPSVPHSGRYRDRSIGMAKQLPRASVWRSPTWRSPRSKLEAQKSPPASAAYPGTPDYAALASSGLSLFRDINQVRRRLQRAPKPIPARPHFVACAAIGESRPYATPFRRKTPKTLTPDRRPCAGRPRGRLPPR